MNDTTRSRCGATSPRRQVSCTLPATHPPATHSHVFDHGGKVIWQSDLERSYGTCDSWADSMSGAVYCVLAYTHSGDHESFTHGSDSTSVDWPNGAGVMDYDPFDAQEDDSFTIDRARAAIGEIELRMTRLEGRLVSQTEINEAMMVLERRVIARVSELENRISRLSERTDLMNLRLARAKADLSEIRDRPKPQAPSACGAVRDGGFSTPEYTCVLPAGHAGDHTDCDGDTSYFD